MANQELNIDILVKYNSLQELEQELQDVNKELSKVSSSDKNFDKLTQKQSILTGATEKYRQAISALDTDIIGQTKSLNDLEQELAQVNGKLKRLPEGSAGFEELTRRQAELTTGIKQFKREISNIEVDPIDLKVKADSKAVDSLQSDLEGLSVEDLSVNVGVSVEDEQVAELKTDINNLELEDANIAVDVAVQDDSIDQLKTDIDSLDIESVELDVLVDNVSLGELERQLEAINEELKETTRNTEGYDQLIAKHQKLTQAAAQYNEEIEGFTFDKKLEAADGAIKIFAGSLQTVVGALGAIGVESEVFGEFEKKAASAIAVGIGVKDLSEGFTKLTKNVKIAEVATKTFGKVSRAALISTGIGALLVALGAVVAYWDEITEKVKSFGEVDTLARQNEQLEEQKGALEDNLDLLESERELLESQGEPIDAVNDKYLERIETLIEVNKQQLQNLEAELLLSQEQDKQVTFWESIKIAGAGYLNNLVGTQATQQLLTDTIEDATAATEETQELQDKIKESTIALNKLQVKRNNLINDEKKATKDILEERKKAILEDAENLKAVEGITIGVTLDQVKTSETLDEYRTRVDELLNTLKSDIENAGLADVINDVFSDVDGVIPDLGQLENVLGAFDTMEKIFGELNTINQGLFESGKITEFELKKRTKALEDIFKTSLGNIQTLRGELTQAAAQLQEIDIVKGIRGEFENSIVDQELQLFSPVDRDALLEDIDFINDSVEVLAEKISTRMAEVDFFASIRDFRIDTVLNGIYDGMGAIETLQADQFDAKMSRLEVERATIENNENLSVQQKERALAKVDARERQLEIQRIKRENDMFTFKQSMVIAEMLLDAQMTGAKLKSEAMLLQARATSTLAGVALDGTKNIAAAKGSVGAFIAALGPWGLAAYAASIVGVIATIVSAKKKAKAQVAAIKAGGSGGGGSVSAGGIQVPSIAPATQAVEAPEQDIDVSPTVRAYVVSGDITSGQEADNKISKKRTLG